MMTVTMKNKLAPREPSKNRQNTKIDIVIILIIKLILSLDKTFIKKGNFNKKLNAVIFMFPEKALSPISLLYKSPEYLSKNLS